MEERGYVKRIERISCRSCGRELVELILFSKPADKPTNVLAKCPYCNDESWKMLVEDSFRIKPVDDNVIIYDNVIVDCNDIMNSEFILAKRG